MKKTEIKDHKKFVLSLITNEFKFYCDLNEGDDSANTIMTDLDDNVLSDNYFASNELVEILEVNNDIVWISEDMKYNQEQILEELNNN